MIADTRKSLGEKDANGKAKVTACWTGIKLVEEYATELLEAKRKEGQERLD